MQDTMLSTLLHACLLATIPSVTAFHVPAGAAIRQAMATDVSWRSSAPLAMNAGRGRHEDLEAEVTRKGWMHRAAGAVLGAAVVVPSTLALAPSAVQARKPGVNRPDLLPKEQTNVIDLVGMLTKGQARRINKQLEDLEKDTGFRLRLLCQRYPETPGLAVKDYWKVDEKTIVMVVDQGDGSSKAGAVNMLNFNVGDGFRLNLPAQFWQRLQNKYGNRFYVSDNGPDTAVISAVDSINLCLRSPSGFCVDPPDLAKAAREQAVLASIGKGGLKD